MKTKTIERQTDAVLIIQPLLTERWNKRQTGYHVYLKTVSDVGPFESKGPYTFTGSPLKHGRVFENSVEAMIFVMRYVRHNKRRYRSIALDAPGRRVKLTN